MKGKGWDINFRVQWIHLHCIHNTILFITWLTAKTHTTLQLHTIQTFFCGCYDNTGTHNHHRVYTSSCVHVRVQSNS